MSKSRQSLKTDLSQLSELNTLFIDETTKEGVENRVRIKQFLEKLNLDLTWLSTKKDLKSLSNYHEFITKLTTQKETIATLVRKINVGTDIPNKIDKLKDKLNKQVTSPPRDKLEKLRVEAERQTQSTNSRVEKALGALGSRGPDVSKELEQLEKKSENKNTPPLSTYSKMPSQPPKQPPKTGYENVGRLERENEANTQGARLTYEESNKFLKEIGNQLEKIATTLKTPDKEQSANAILELEKIQKNLAETKLYENYDFEIQINTHQDEITRLKKLAETKTQKIGYKKSEIFEEYKQDPAVSEAKSSKIESLEPNPKEAKEIQPTLEDTEKTLNEAFPQNLHGMEEIPTTKAKFKKEVEDAHFFLNKIQTKQYQIIANKSETITNKIAYLEKLKIQLTEVEFPLDATKKASFLIDNIKNYIDYLNKKRKTESIIEKIIEKKETPTTNKEIQPFFNDIDDRLDAIQTSLKNPDSEFTTLELNDVEQCINKAKQLLSEEHAFLIEMKLNDVDRLKNQLANKEIKSPLQKSNMPPQSDPKKIGEGIRKKTSNKTFSNAKSSTAQEEPIELKIIKDYSPHKTSSEPPPPSHPDANVPPLEIYGTPLENPSILIQETDELLQKDKESQIMQRNIEATKISGQLKKLREHHDEYKKLASKLKDKTFLKQLETLGKPLKEIEGNHTSHMKSIESLTINTSNQDVGKLDIEIKNNSKAIKTFTEQLQTLTTNFIKAQEEFNPDEYVKEHPESQDKQKETDDKILSSAFSKEDIKHWQHLNKNYARLISLAQHFEMQTRNALVSKSDYQKLTGLYGHIKALRVDLAAYQKGFQIKDVTGKDEHNKELNRRKVESKTYLTQLDKLLNQLRDAETEFLKAQHQQPPSMIGYYGEEADLIDSVKKEELIEKYLGIKLTDASDPDVSVEIKSENNLRGIPTTKDFTNAKGENLARVIRNEYKNDDGSKTIETATAQYMQDGEFRMDVYFGKEKYTTQYIDAETNEVKGMSGYRSKDFSMLGERTSFGWWPNNFSLPNDETLKMAGQMVANLRTPSSNPGTKIIINVKTKEIAEALVLSLKQNGYTDMAYTIYITTPIKNKFEFKPTDKMLKAYEGQLSKIAANEPNVLPRTLRDKTVEKYKRKVGITQVGGEEDKSTHKLK